MVYLRASVLALPWIDLLLRVPNFGHILDHNDDSQRVAWDPFRIPKRYRQRWSRHSLEDRGSCYYTIVKRITIPCPREESMLSIFSLEHISFQHHVGWRPPWLDYHDDVDDSIAPPSIFFALCGISPKIDHLSSDWADGARHIPGRGERSNGRD